MPRTAPTRGIRASRITSGLLALALDAGMGIGVAYGVWTAIGVALTAVLSKALWNEPLTAVMGLGIALIAGGVILLEFGAG